MRRRLLILVGILALGLAGQTSAVCENVTRPNGVTFSIISPRDSSLWVGTASRGLLRVGATGRPFAYSTLTGHLECDSIVALAFDENGLLWIRDGRDAVITYSTVEGFVKRSEVPDSIWEILFHPEKETAAAEADSTVYKVRKSPVWPWILVIVCLIGVIAYLWFIYPRRRHEENEASSPARPVAPSSQAAKIAPQKAAVAQPEIAIEDDDFEAKVRDLIEKNYKDKYFSVEQIAAELGISRVHLSRKLKALNAASPSDMIKSRRMDAAAAMLRSGERNMTVVAASCGFASAAYFSSAFKAFYGVSPSAFE